MEWMGSVVAMKNKSMSCVELSQNWRTHYSMWLLKRSRWRDIWSHLVTGGHIWSHLITAGHYCLWKMRLKSFLLFDCSCGGGGSGGLLLPLPAAVLSAFA